MRPKVMQMRLVIGGRLLGIVVWQLASERSEVCSKHIAATRIEQQVEAEYDISMGNLASILRHSTLSCRIFRLHSVGMMLQTLHSSQHGLGLGVALQSVPETYQQSTLNP